MASTSKAAAENMKTNQADQPSSISAIDLSLRGTKTELVDTDGEEFPDPKKSTKQSAIALLLHWHEFLVKIFLLSTSNIDEVADVTTMLSIIHTKLRQEVIGIEHDRQLVPDNFIFTAKSTSKKLSELKPTIVKIASMYGFIYGISDMQMKKIGVLGSFLKLFGFYRMRFDETRVGTNTIIIKKNAVTRNELPISIFGLRPEHSVLMTGSSYYPSVQSSLKFVLGPMTVAVNLAMQKKWEHQLSWKQAFMRVFMLYPYCKEIADLLAGSEQHNGTLLGLLADIALFGTTRSNNIVTPPFSLLLSVARKVPSYVDFFSREFPNTPIQPAMVHAAIQGIDFSGKGAFLLWHAAESVNLKMKGNTMTETTASEMLFHSTWGTAKEDLGLLEWMTGHHFLTRQQIGNQLKERSAGNIERNAAVIQFKYISKLAGVSQTNFFSGGKGQISRVPVFSGKCVRVSVEYPLLKILPENKEKYVEGIVQKPTIIARLYELRKSLEDGLKKEQSFAFETTAFFHFDSTLGYGASATRPVDLPRRYFYGENDFLIF